MIRFWAAALFAAVITLIAFPADAAEPARGATTVPVAWSRAEGNAPIPPQAQEHREHGDDLITTGVISANFDMIGLLWDQGELEHVWLQTRDTRGLWGEWTEVPVEVSHDEDDGGSRPGSLPVYTGDATAVRFVGVGSASGIEAMMINTQSLGDARSDDLMLAQGLGGFALTAQVSSLVELPTPWWSGPAFVRDRGEWDTGGCRRPDADYFFSTPRALVVHHTAASNSYTESDVPGIIRGHCLFHVEGRGWDDLAYNFMVDRFGNVWEGRTSSKTTASRGGHVAGFNSQTQGIALMGNYESTPPPTPQITALRQILEWLTGWHSIDPQGTVTLYAGSGNLGGWGLKEPVVMPTIVGHRDLGSTSCPGAAFYATFPSLRASIQPDGFGFDPAAITCQGRRPTIYGTLGHDQMFGTPGVDVIHGLAGSDLIFGLEQGDFICGGAGDDYLVGGGGADSVTGEAGFDTCGGEGQGSCEDVGNSEMFFYREDGIFRYYDIGTDGVLSAPLLEGDGYTLGWDAITAVDLDGDGQDEMFFYRADGVFRYYDVRPDGTLGSPIREGDGYTTGWSSITAVDLDGGGQDEMLFYRDDGLFRYYNVNETGEVGSPILSGENYTTDWSSIVAVDLDGDVQDEMLFYRDDGIFRYYDIQSDGTLTSPMSEGDGYTIGWSSIDSVDLDGDGQDEAFFYREDGVFRYYQIREDGTLPKPILGGEDYTTGWSSISAVDIDLPYSTPTG